MPKRSSLLPVLALAWLALPTAAAAAADRNHDGLPDRWEAHYRLSTTQSSGCASLPTQGLINAAASDVAYAQYSRLLFVYNCPGNNFGSATSVGPVSTPQGTVQAAQIAIDAGSAAGEGMVCA